MSSPSLSPVGEQVSLEKRTYDAIKGAILGFTLKPGDALIETDLALQLGISKTPVRDALLRLEKEGLVEKIPFKGSYVAEITKELFIQLFQIRATLEGLAAGLATPFLSEEDIRTCESAILEHRNALQNGNIEAAAKYNKNFHHAVLCRCTNRHLLEILSNLDDNIQRFRLMSNYQRGVILKSVQEHEAILDAIRRKSPDDVEKAMKVHLTNVIDELSSQDFNKLIEFVSQRSNMDTFKQIYD